MNDKYITNLNVRRQLRNRSEYCALKMAFCRQLKEMDVLFSGKCSTSELFVKTPELS